MKGKKKLLSWIFLGAVGLMLVINLVFFAKDDKTKDVAKDEQTKETVAKDKKANEEKDPLEETKKATTNLYRNNIGAIGTGEEYDEKEAAILKNKLLKLAETGDYGLIIEEGEELMEDNTFSKGENLDIAGMIYDANTMVTALQKNDVKEYGKAAALSTVPETLVISTLFGDNFGRRYVIQDPSSLAPVGFDNVKLGERRTLRTIKDAEDEELFASQNIAEDIFNTEENVNAIYVFDIMIEDLNNLPLTAYVWEDLYGKLYFEGMYAPDDFESYEHDLQWWIDHDYIYENAEKAQEEQAEQKAKDGTFTTEDWNEFLEQW